MVLEGLVESVSVEQIGPHIAPSQAYRLLQNWTVRGNCSSLVIAKVPKYHAAKDIVCFFSSIWVNRASSGRFKEPDYQKDYHEINTAQKDYQKIIKLVIKLQAVTTSCNKQNHNI
jgi:hypothetical protein